ncbi:MAG: hypothetical protein WBA87_04850 [Microbacterium sp.]
MSEPQPEYVWAFPDEKPKRGRVWLIVVLVVVAVAIAAGLFWLFLRPSLPGALGTPTPTLSASDSPSPSATPSATSMPTPTSIPTTEPTTPSPPEPVDPSIATFREKVAPVLGDAQTGLRFAAESDTQEAAQNVGFLQEDAGRMADYIAPRSIAAQWSSRLTAYSRSLQSLRTAYENGGSANSELAAAKAALAELNKVVG